MTCKCSILHVSSFRFRVLNSSLPETSFIAVLRHSGSSFPRPLSRAATAPRARAPRSRVAPWSTRTSLTAAGTSMERGGSDFQHDVDKVKLQLEVDLKDDVMRSGSDHSFTPLSDIQHPLNLSKEAKRHRGFWSRRPQLVFAIAVGLAVVLAVSLGLGFGLNRHADKHSWPECEGMEATRCKALIEYERPELRVYIGSMHGAYTMDFDSHRVRIMADDEGITARTPTIG